MVAANANIFAELTCLYLLRSVLPFFVVDSTEGFTSISRRYDIACLFATISCPTLDASICFCTFDFEFTHFGFAISDFRCSHFRRSFSFSRPLLFLFGSKCFFLSFLFMFSFQFQVVGRASLGNDRAVEDKFRNAPPVER